MPPERSASPGPPDERVAQASPGVFARGATIGRYVVLDVLGKGGMGVVYAAYDSQLDRKVAIKLLRPDLAHGGDAEESESRLLREAQAMARLTHPNVVTVHDVGVHEQLVFIAMEFVDGVTLKAWLDTEPPLPERLRVLSLAGRGLAAAHKAGIVHRDFKPDNVIVGRDGRVVVLDFGLARAEGEQADSSEKAPPARPPRDAIQTPSSDALSNPLTLSGTLLGTVGYIAPEQAFGEAASAATDQFGYGVTLYVALYREKPFPDPIIEGYLTQLYRPVPEPKQTGGVPSRIRRIVLRALSPDPRDRFPSMDALLRELERGPEIVRRRALAVAALALTLALGIVLFGLWQRQRALICAVAPGELQGVWDESGRAAVERAFELASPQGGREKGGWIATKLDAWSASWLLTREEACTATRIQKTQSEEVFRLRNECLDREKVEVRTITSMLAKADLGVVEKTLEIAYGLPQLSWCADIPALRASAGLPDDPKKREQVEVVRAKLAEAEAADLAGRTKESREIGRAAEELARAANHSPTTAEALCSLGMTIAQQGDFEHAVPSLSEAAFLALGGGADSIAVRAASSLAYVMGAGLGRAEEGRMWLGIARAALTRMGGSEERELEVMRSEASLLDEADQRPELAVPIQEKLVASYRRLYGVHPKTKSALHNLANIYVNLGEPERARPVLEEAVKMAETLGGPEYRSLGMSAYLLGQTLLELGETASGGAFLERAVAIFEVNGMHFWSAAAMERLAASALAEGDYASARERIDRATASMVKAKSPGVLVPVVNVTAGLVRVRLHEDGALALCTAAVAELEKQKAMAKEKVFAWDALRCEAEALLASGRALEAIPLLERSLTLDRRMLRGDYARAEFALARALTAAHRDPARAFELAKAARASFAEHPFLAFEQREVDAWLAKHAGGR